MARRCFYSFHYNADSRRAARIRQIGAIEGNRPATDNGWETITKGGDHAIRRWINGQMQGRSCAIVLVGARTANRKWINYEIDRAWEKGMGVVGVRIHRLVDLDGRVSERGANPFDYVYHPRTRVRLSSIVGCHEPVGPDSKACYGWIAGSLPSLVEEAVAIRKAN